MPSNLSERNEVLSSEQRPVGKGIISLIPDQRQLQQPSTGFKSSAIDVIEYTYPLKLMVPRFASSTQCKWIYPISFGGGLVEGDCIDVSLSVGDECVAVYTTQASTKVYHCNEGKQTKQKTKCCLGNGAFLAMLPDPVVPFKNADFSQSQNFEMSSSSNLVLLDWVTAGRVARKEVWDFNRVASSYLIEIDGKAVLRDGTQLRDSPSISLKDALPRYMIIGSLVLIGPQLESLVASLERDHGQPKPIHGTYDSDEMLSFSPLHFTSHGLNVTGCLLRFCFSSVGSAYTEISGVLKPIFPILGGNPFENKF
ncbi:hypothetical protein CAPTEDRAFT_223530 [Capitella teleta]|uniref:Urease accessory protein UreD n=1 Tax=Capitella teleta TaxID=283909 RepID=R7U0Z4_CAPTE|nr:hypothetical protein CAPTEDRAFT_223530 [Capitella teleta]|eukprot:ELT97296.1 hypothetical protein CAPTEDRAFT_223530 [Capitella teleta]